MQSNRRFLVSFTSVVSAVIVPLQLLPGYGMIQHNRTLPTTPPKLKAVPPLIAAELETPTRTLTSIQRTTIPPPTPVIPNSPMSTRSNGISTTESTIVPQPIVVTVTSSTNVASHLITVASSTALSSSSGKGFFQNTAAVVGTFTAVGIVGLVLLIFFGTFIIRRRAKLDHNIDETTTKFANPSVDAFLEHRYKGGGGDHGDASSHGQQPMNTEAYRIRETGHGIAGVGAGMGYRAGDSHDLYAYGNGYGLGKYLQDYTDYAQAQYNPFADPIPSATGYNPNRSGYNTYADARHTGVSQEEYNRHPGTQLRRGLSLTHYAVLPNPYESPEYSQAQVQQGGAGMDDAYDGYVEDHRHGHHSYVQDRVGDEKENYGAEKRSRVFKA
ncbi:hypothetical protein C0995_005254 [Termitomyces sp. Mi166|nr:hypothetical protein C0995_005254 [Termitomyces sp. Mi166\